MERACKGLDFVMAAIAPKHHRKLRSGGCSVSCAKNSVPADMKRYPPLAEQGEIYPSHLRFSLRTLA